MAPTSRVHFQDEDNSSKANGCWMRFRRKTTLKEVTQTKITFSSVAIRRTNTDRHPSSSHSYGLESNSRVKGSSRGASRSRSEIHFTRYEGRKDALPPRVEKHLSTIAQTSGNVKRMTMELDTHQKCVRNLAATVVRQDEEIRRLKRQIAELAAVVEEQPPCSSDASGSPGSMNISESDTGAQSAVLVPHMKSRNPIFEKSSRASRDKKGVRQKGMRHRRSISHVGFFGERTSSED